MSGTETWLLVALIVAGVGALLHVLSALPAADARLSRLGHAFVAAAVGLLAIALIVAFP